MTQRQRAQAFKTLHQTGFIMPNAWDPGSALVLADTGFLALGTTSAGIAFSLGKQDYRVSDPRLAVSRDEMLAAVARIVDCTQLPVNGDLEAGFGDSPQAVADTALAAVALGLAGCNIEDKPAQRDDLYDVGLAADRIAAARQALAAQGADLFINARTDAVLLGEGPDAAIARANRYLAAGADGVFVPGVIELEAVRRLVGEIEGPLNVVLGLSGPTGDAHELLAAGVKRVSLGGAFARAGLGFLRQSAMALRDTGGADFTRNEFSGPDLNALFARARA